MVNQVVIFIVGLILGGIAVWLGLNRRVLDSDGRAKTNEGTLTELRSQLQQKEVHLTQLQTDLNKQQEARVAAETRLAELRSNLEEQKKNLAETVQRLSDAFNSLSTEALKSNNQIFLDLAKKTMEGVLSEAKGDLKVRQEAMDGTIKPLQETLKRYEDQLREIETKRSEAYGGLLQHLTEMKQTHELLRKETTTLSSALKTPQVRGSWGELTLRRVVEMAGMSKYCDFEEQFSVSTEEGRLRPDLIIKLPGNRTIVVDAKAPVQVFRKALEVAEEEGRKNAFSQYAKAVREYMKKLSSKEYWKHLAPSPEFVILFLPGESFFSAALEQDNSLMEDGFASRVILATPTTLISLLRTVATTWQQQDVTENARRIWETGQELFERLSIFSEHLDGIRKGLAEAAKSYNAAVGSWETRLLPGIRRLKELGTVSSDKEVIEIDSVDVPLKERTHE